MNEVARPSPERRAEERERKRLEIEQRIAAGPWRDAVKRYGVRTMANAYVVPKPMEWVSAQLDTISDLVPDDVLDASRTQHKLGVFLSSSRGSVLNRLAEAMGRPAWEEMLRGAPEAYEGVTMLSVSTDLSRRRPKFLEALRAQASVEIETSEDEETGAETREFLEKTGFLDIVRRVATKVRMEPIEGDWKASGGHEKSTGHLIVRARPEHRRYVPGIILHESGHGLNDLLSGVERGQEWFERYAADALLRPEPASSYAESFVKSDEVIWKFKNGRAGDTFIRESFAEDFMRYWLDQDSVAKERRLIFDEIADEVFPDVNREEMRVRIRQYLRQKYDVAPADTVHPRDCETTERMANERIEEARKRSEEYAARQAAKKTA